MKAIVACYPYKKTEEKIYSPCQLTFSTVVTDLNESYVHYKSVDCYMMVIQYLSWYTLLAVAGAGAVPPDATMV